MTGALGAKAYLTNFSGWAEVADILPAGTFNGVSAATYDAVCSQRRHRRTLAIHATPPARPLELDGPRSDIDQHRAVLAVGVHV